MATMDTKSAPVTLIQDSKEDVEQPSSPEYQDGSPSRPQHQTLLRFINLPSAVNFEICVQAAWETLATTFQFSLLNGGPASIIYGGILTGFGCSAIALSLAEMASMDPIVGAQYRWSANFAPAAPRFWGLIQGWLTVFAWIVSAATNPANLANMVTALIIFNKEDYVYHRWHTSMLMWLFILLPLVFNLWFKKFLNVFETAGAIIHFAFFFASIITLAALAQRSTIEYVFHTVVNDVSGWTNPGVAFGIGLIPVALGPVGTDGVLHMSAEIKHVRTRAPYSIIISTVSNAIMQWAFAICLLFTIGNVDTDTNTPTGLPMIEVYHQATNSVAATNVFIVAIALVISVSLFNVLASASRLTWAFARDHGLPYSRFFSQIHPKYKVPLNTLCLVSAICFLLSLIYIGSSTAFNAIISLTTLTLYISYICPILFFMLRKIRGPPLDYGPFQLGRWGIPINIASLAYIFYTATWIPFPIVLPVTAQNMNYSGPILLAIIVAALIDWSITGHKRFELPVAREISEF